MKDENKCKAKRCHRESDIIFEGEPYCQQHYEQKLIELGYGSGEVS